jgi:hypothetical protein
MILEESNNKLSGMLGRQVTVLIVPVFFTVLGKGSGASLWLGCWIFLMCSCKGYGLSAPSLEN